MDFFDDIFSWEDKPTFEKAYAIANDAHKGQSRDEGTPLTLSLVKRKPLQLIWFSENAF